MADYQQNRDADAHLQLFCPVAQAFTSARLHRSANVGILDSPHRC